MADDFVYAQLQHDEIRLIRMTHDTSQLEYELRNFPLTNAPECTALSYCWGDPARSIGITSNGKILRVTKSLKAFLDEVGSRRDAAGQKFGWPSGWFWIDAVCINQDDLIERSEQVKKMREIYEKASTMIIWLGEADFGTSDAFNVLEEIVELDCKDFKLTDGAMPGVSCRLGDADTGVDIPYETLTYDIGGILWSTYWNRAWVIQEASTPKDDPGHDEGCRIWVCCGSCTLQWDVLTEANKRLLVASWNNEVEENANLHGVANGDIATLEYIQDRRRTKTYHESLYPMLVRSSTSAATDAKDKLYAIAGLVKERDDQNLQPDYNLSVEQIYTKAARTIIESSQSLDCLGSASLLRDHDVPSWTPDWTVQHSKIPQPFYQYDQVWSRDGSVKRDNLFNASTGLTPQINFDNNGRCLVARGFCFDAIASLSVPRLRSGTDVSSERTWQDWIKTANPALSTYASGCARIHAFEKVLRADIAEVWGDWSAERGSSTGTLTHSSLNAFDLQDAILDAMTWNRRLFVTKNGHLGLGPSTLEENDRLCILFGSQMPLILRQQGSHWLSVGQAYVHGLMDGEAVVASKRQDDQLFHLH